MAHALQASPEFKGIKTCSKYLTPSSSLLQASPEFKGIKTPARLVFSILRWLQASPEFKGIKTRFQTTNWSIIVSFKPALNSKGLRQSNQRPLDGHRLLQASPEFKGIKTACSSASIRGSKASSQP